MVGICGWGGHRRRSYRLRKEVGMLDVISHSAYFIGILSILSGVRILINHLFPASQVGTILGKIVDIMSGNVAH